jgi:UDPglucose 6-dehydrogenase
MQICVIGTGYVGLVTGTCLSDTGQKVVCVDKDERIVETLRTGVPTIYERGLPELLKSNVDAGRLLFTTDLASAVRDAAVVFIAVGTPPMPDGSVDMSHCDTVAEQISAAADSHKIVVMKSTVPVGTHKRMAKIFADKARVGIDYVSNPEFLKEGSAVEDFTKPDRVVIGSTNPQAGKTIAHLYSPFMRQSQRILITDPASAEMLKYTANSMLASRISFMNEVARLCDHYGANVEDVRRGVGMDRRIGSAFLFPGLGYGGYCFPKDVQAMAWMGRECGSPMRVAEATHAANLGQVDYFKTVIDRHFRGEYQGRKIAVWGLAYKARTDDVRMSAAVSICKWLAEQGADVVAHDPQAMPKASEELGGQVQFSEHMYEMLDGAEALLVMTDWQEFRNPDMDQLRQLLRERVIIDGRNLYEPEWMREHGFTYHSVGRPAVNG